MHHCIVDTRLKSIVFWMTSQNVFISNQDPLDSQPSDFSTKTVEATIKHPTSKFDMKITFIVRKAARKCAIFCPG